MKQTVNERITLLRIHLDLTQVDFAKLMHITTAQLSRLENGHNKPQQGTLQRILSAIDVPQAWLFEGKGELVAKLRKPINNNVKDAESAAPNEWREEAYEEVKARNTDLSNQVKNLNIELNRVWAVVAQLSKASPEAFLLEDDGAAQPVHPALIAAAMGGASSSRHYQA